MNTPRSKFTLGVLSLALLFSSTGCMTSVTLHQAEAKTHKDSAGTLVVDKKQQPVYYALLPITVPADVATSPLQALYGGLFFFFAATSVR